MADRINQRWPDGLYERVRAVAGARGVTSFTVRAVEQALGSRGGPSAASGGDEAEVVTGRAPTPAEPYVPDWKKMSLGSRPSGPVPKGKP